MPPNLLKDSNKEFFYRIKRRQDMANMVPRDQMLILLGKLSCTINVSPMTCSTRQAPGSEKGRERVRTAYMIVGKSVCRETFMYLHAISRDRLTALLKCIKPTV